MFETTNGNKDRDLTLIKEQPNKKLVIVNWYEPNSMGVNNIKGKQKEMQRKSSISYHFSSACNSHNFAKLYMIWKSPQFIVALRYKGVCR